MRNQIDASVVGERIRKRRTDRGMTQAELGQPRFTSAYISLIERGHRKPSDEVLEFVAHRLDLDIHELLTGTPAGLEAELELELQQTRREMDQANGKLLTEQVARILDQANKFGLKRVRARAEETLAGIAERTRGPAAALEHYERAERLWQGEPLHLRAETVTGLAHCATCLGDAPMAVHVLDSYRRQLVASGQPHPLALIRTYTEMVYAYFSVGLPDKAGDAAREALRLEGQVESAEDIACMHLTVARSLLFEGQHHDALTSIRRADEIYSAGGWRSKAAKARIAEGIVLSKKEDYEAARDRLLSALEILEGAPNPTDEALALNNLGRVHRHLGDVDTALSYLDRAQPLLKRSAVLDQAFNTREVGLCFLSLDVDVCETRLKEALELYRTCRAAEEVAATYTALGDLYRACGHTELALGAYRDGLEYLQNRASSHQ